jgi:two-component system response regulator YesN
MYKILVVDDEDEIRNGMLNYFPWGDVGFDTVIGAKDGKEALNLLQEYKIDVILTDIKMPILDGIDLARELYEQKSKIKVIFLTGYRDFEFAQRAIEYGVKNYIVKPTKYNELIEIFTRVKEEMDSENCAKVKSIDYPTLVNTKNTGNFNSKIIDTIKEYTENHYSSVTLEDISKVVHMNFQYVSKYFKQKTGQNFSNYVIEVKMRKAAELISNFNYKTYEVSELMGYTNPKNFTRTFKSFYGKGPREYKNSQNLI